MDLVSKIALGTVQFGLDYGINNKNGQIKEQEVFKILTFANENNLKMLDTSYLYGNSEKVIGNFIEKTNNNFKIISKLPSIDNDVEKYFLESLNRLNQKKLYGYLIHHFDFFKNNPSIWSLLEKLKKESKIEKIGFSLYYPSELDYIYNLGIKPDLVQFPYNIFDQRFETKFEQLKNNNVEIHTRSVFLQGLFFINPNDLKPQFDKIKPKIIKLNKISEKYNVPIQVLTLLFAAKNNNIDKIVIGIDSIDNLKENISFKFDLDSALYYELKTLREDDENIILPFNWNR